MVLFSLFLDSSSFEFSQDVQAGGETPLSLEGSLTFYIIFAITQLPSHAIILPSRDPSRVVSAVQSFA